MKTKEQYKNLNNVIENEGFCFKLEDSKDIFYSILSDSRYKKEFSITLCNELNDLLTKLKEGKIIVVDEDYCNCGNPSKEGYCEFENEEKMIYICSDCRKRVKE